MSQMFFGNSCVMLFDSSDGGGGSQPEENPFLVYYKCDGDSDWREYEVAEGDIVEEDDVVAFKGTSFKHQDFFSNVREVKLPSKWKNANDEEVDVTSIGQDAFRECIGLMSVTIPNSVTSVGSCAFYNCTSLTSVTIPDSVTSIDTAAFVSCISLTSVTITANNGNAANVKQMMIHVGCSEEYTIIWHMPTGDEHVKTWYKYADDTEWNIVDDLMLFGSIGLVNSNGTFTGVIDNPTDIVAIEIGTGTQANTLTAIDAYGFNKLSNLVSITIPNTVTDIGSSAFRQCTKLKSITIPDSVSSLGQYAFQGCTALENAVIGSGITTISDQTFRSCTNLKDIVIPDSVTTISQHAFRDTGLTGEVVLPYVETVGTYAFSGSTISSIRITESIVSFSTNVFRNCAKLESITITDKDSISIGLGTFSNCSMLNTVTILPTGHGNAEAVQSMMITAGCPSDITWNM